MLFGADGRAHGVEVLDRVGGGVEAQVGLLRQVGDAAAGEIRGRGSAP